MSGFHFVFRRDNMFINFGYLPQYTVVNLCSFMRVFNFPPNFFREPESYYDVVMEFYGKDEVVVTIDGKECYHGDFDEAWNNYEYYTFFEALISDLRHARDDLDFADQEGVPTGRTEDQLDNLVRDVDYLNLFTDYLDDMSELDEQEERIQREEREEARLNARVSATDEKIDKPKGFLDGSDSDDE